MAQKIINNGTYEDDPLAESIREAFEKTKDNFSELYDIKEDKLNKIDSPFSNPNSTTNYLSVKGAMTMSLPVANIVTESNFTVSANTDEGTFQSGRDIIVKNNVNDVIISCNKVTAARYTKGGTKRITFVAGIGRTIVAMNGSLVLDGPIGQQGLLISDGTIDRFYIQGSGKNLFTDDQTLTANRTHNLGAKKLKFTNGDFEVPALTLTETAENTKPNKINTADGLIVKWTNKLGIQRVFAFLSDVLDKTTLIAQSVASKVTFNGTIVHNPPTTPFIKSVIVLDNNNEFKQSTAVELMADDGAVTKYASEVELDDLFPGAISGFELLCPNIETVNFPSGCIYKKTNVGWKVEKLYNLSDV